MTELSALAASALLSIACAGSQPHETTPEQTVIALSRALSDGKAAEAYALMSDDFRRRVSFEAWEAALNANAQEVIEASQELSRGSGKATVQAVVPYGDRELVLQRQGDRWVVESDVTAFYEQSTPRAALHAFVRALTRKRYDVLLRLCPDADKEGMTEETMRNAWLGRASEDIERLLTNLRVHENDPIEIAGNRATMPYAGNRQVQLLREGGVWKIEDPE